MYRRNLFSSPSTTPSNFPIYFSFFLLFVTTPIHSSKLKEVIIRSIDQVFDGSNNVITNPTGNNVAKNEGSAETQNASSWQNEGFIGANATQITSSFGSTIGISTKLLLATKASSLSTQINDFSHTFLVIKFSSIIGHTELEIVELPVSTEVSPQDPLEENPGNEEVLLSSTLSYPPGLSPLRFIPKIPIVNEEQHNGESKIPASLQIRDSVPFVKFSDQHSSPMIINPILAIASEPNILRKPQLPPTGPAILKLNAEGNQVIEIALDSTTLPKNEPSPSGIKMDKKSDETFSKGGEPLNPESISSEISFKMSPARRKRDLNSEEISQIHKILTFTKNMKNKEQSKEVNKSPKFKTNQDEIISEQDALGAEELALAKEEEIKTEEEDEPMSMSIKGLNTAKKLSYQTWRASMDKSFRPPGFYVTVDDKVVFDNWVGVWQSSQSPTVMGRWSTPKKNGIWNDTALMLQFDENPDRNIKISFEWEPTDPTAYLFLSNISISTYEGNGSDASIGPENTSADTDSSNIFGGSNRNITLYIVLKTPSQGTEHVIRMGDKPEVVEQRVMQIQPNLNNYPTLTLDSYFPNANPIPQSVLNSISPTTNPPPKIVFKEKPPQSNFPSTGLIVACVIGCLSCIILIFLVRKKMQINKSPNHQNHAINAMYIDEL